MSRTTLGRMLMLRFISIVACCGVGGLFMASAVIGSDVVVSVVGFTATVFLATRL